MDESSEFQGSKDKTLLAQIATLNRLLARMDEGGFNLGSPRSGNQRSAPARGNHSLAR
jgi:hypothetical protein